MKKLICHGDSLTRGADLAPSATWPNLVARELCVGMSNTGVCGDTTAGMLSRFHPEVIAMKPDIVLITGGTNDLWWGLPMTSVLANLFTMSCQAEHYGMACVIGLPIPIVKQKAMMQDFLGPVGGYDRCIEELDRLVEALVTRAEDNGVPCIDFYDLFSSATGHVVSEYFLEDGLHANEKGHRRMAERAVRMLRSRFDLS
jgi:acyl-CoA thioesterase I